MAQLSPDLKTDKSLSRYRTISDAAKSLLDLEGKSANAVVLPGAQATKEEWDRYYKAVGRPDKPSDYKLEKITLPEGLVSDAKVEEAFLAHAHSLGLSQDQVAKIHAWYTAEMVKTTLTNQRIVKTSAEDAKGELRKQHGAKFDETMSLAGRFYTRLAGNDKELENAFARSGIINNSRLINRFAEMERKIGEAPVAQGATVNNQPDFGAKNRDAYHADILYGGKMKKGA
jgi:hypothetical protein